MKTILYIGVSIILFFGFYQNINAQEVNNLQEEFIETTWYLSKIEIDEEIFSFEANEETAYTTLTTEQVEEQTDFYLDYCHGAVGEGLNFITDNSFVIQDFVIPMIECEDSENNNYKVKYFDVFTENADQVFEYSIIEEENSKSLLITTENNNRLYYQNTTLSTSKIEFSQISLYPNPIKDQLTIDNLTTEAALTLYDLSGKKLFSEVLTEKSIELNLSFLAEGMYIYRLEDKHGNFKTGKLVKK